MISTLLYLHHNALNIGSQWSDIATVIGAQQKILSIMNEAAAPSGILQAAAASVTA